jgi:hypothetical protein
MHVHVWPDVGSNRRRMWLLPPAAHVKWETHPLPVRALDKVSIRSIAAGAFHSGKHAFKTALGFWPWALGLLWG